MHDTRAKEIVDRLCDLSPAEREAWFDGQPADQTLRTRVLSVLARFDALMVDSAALDNPVSSAVQQLAEDAPVEAPETLGPYRILGTLGAGGMGVVYRGVQSEPRREVAVKVLRGALLGAASLRRFEREAELLGRLQHPGIAQVIELGRTADGETFLVMEFIAGERLTVHAERHALDREARLLLIVDLAEAVHHAHLRGVVHRDLKPANVLVTESGQVKVIDFGVARALDEQADVTQHTRAGQLVGTLAYMSPEQVQGDPSAVDARADVYALGVLAYELLGGRLPHDLTTASVPQAVSVVAEVEPAPLGRIAPACRGDLELIVAKALAKEPERRYQSAAALADDLRRFLAHEPVEARAPSALYGLSRLARRHRGVFAALGLALLAIVVGAAVAVRQALDNKQLAEEAQQLTARATANARAAEEARAEESRRAEELESTVGVLDEVLAGVDAQQTGERWRSEVLLQLGRRWDALGLDADDAASRRASAEALLEQADLTGIAGLALHEALFEPWRQAIDSGLADQPLVRARLLDRLSRAQTQLGFIVEAADTTRAAIDLREHELGPDDEATLKSRLLLAQLLQNAGQPEAAWELYAQLEEPLTRVLGPDHTQTLLCLLGIAASKTARGDLAGSIALQRRALQAATSDSGQGVAIVPTIQALLARHLFHTGALEETESLQRAALATWSDAEGNEANTAMALGDLALTLERQGRIMEGLDLVADAVDRLTLSEGRTDLATLEMLDRLALFHMMAGQPEQARPLLAEVLEVNRRTYAQRLPSAVEHAALVKRLADQGECLRMLGRLDEALQSLEEARELSVEVPAGHPLHGTIAMWLQQVLRELEQRSPGEGWAERAAALSSGSVPR